MEIHGVTTPKVVFFIATAMGISDPTNISGSGHNVTRIFGLKKNKARIIIILFVLLFLVG
jgi:ABC-type Fe3+-siderophore transport system permease subunit